MAIHRKGYDMDDETSGLLIRLLAETDALYLPFRDPTATWWAFGWTMRRHYPTRGLPWRSHERSGSAAAKATERKLKDLVDAGSIKTLRPRGIKTLCVRLTDEGDQLARALADIPNLDCGVATVKEIARQSQTKEHRGVSFLDARG